MKSEPALGVAANTIGWNSSYEAEHWLPQLMPEAGTLVVDRFLYTAMRYPGNYGFIPHTLSGDGDPSLTEVLTCSR